MEQSRVENKMKFKLCDIQIKNILITTYVEENSGYINATYISKTINPSLCKRGENAFHNWADLESSKQFIHYVKTKLEDDVTEPIFYVSKEDNEEYYGMYVHLTIIPQFISWLSPFLALKISEIVLLDSFSNQGKEIEYD